MEEHASRISVKAWLGVGFATLALGFGAVSQTHDAGVASTGIMFCVAFFVSLFGWSLLSLNQERAGDES